MKTWTAIALCVALAPGAPAMAQDDAGEPAATLIPEDAAAAPLGFIYAGTNLVERDPFWPVGYVPPSLLASGTPSAGVAEDDHTPPSEPKLAIDWPRLRLSGMTRKKDGGYVGLIEGVGLVEKGDVVRMRRGDVVYRWRVDSIGTDGVEAQRIEARAVTEKP